MRRRRKLSRKGSQKVYRKGRKVHRRNRTSNAVINRGGIRM